MTTRKAKPAKSEVAAPRGFVPVSTSMGGFWKPELPGQAIQGVVTETVTKKGPDGENTFYILRITDPEVSGPIVDKDGKQIDAEEGMTVGVGGKMLMVFLRGREGKEVYISYSGLGPKKPRQNAPKLFETFERSGE